MIDEGLQLFFAAPNGTRLDEVTRCSEARYLGNQDLGGPFCA